MDDMSLLVGDADICLDRLLDQTLALGADAADARIDSQMAVGIEVRDSRPEAIEHEERLGIFLRAMIGKRQAHVAGSDLSEAGMRALARRVTDMARAAPEDPYCGLADAASLASNASDLGLDGDSFPGNDHLEASALDGEAAALAVPGIVKSDHVSASWQQVRSTVAATNGFRGTHGECLSSVTVSAIAERKGVMERDYESYSARRFADLPAAAAIGRTAGARAVKRLGAVKIESRTAPVIFDCRLSAHLLGSFIGAISGPAIARGVSFLKDRLGQKVFADGVTIVDDPLRPGGFGSRAFDGEGHPVQRTEIVSNGVLTDWLLSGPSARKLGLVPNGFSSWGFGDPPGVSVSNMDLLPGTLDLEALMAEAGEGLHVTDMFGPSVNANTGDYSVGVSGFWFAKGQPSFPVEEVTVAGDLTRMFARAIPGSDIEIRTSVNAPSLLIEGMRLGGI